MKVDHCTLFPDGLQGKDWSQCCATHDYSYEVGAPKREADVNLYNCIYDSTGFGWLAALMFIGVSIFGHFFYKRTKQ